MGETEVFQEENRRLAHQQAILTEETAIRLICQLTLEDARLRAVESRIFFRNRSVLGVVSTYSSGEMYSSARSRVIRTGGASWIPLPSPWLRIFVRCLVLQGFTLRSSGREFSPTIIPSYTSSCGPINNLPRS